FPNLAQRFAHAGPHSVGIRETAVAGYGDANSARLGNRNENVAALPEGFGNARDRGFVQSAVGFWLRFKRCDVAMQPEHLVGLWGSRVTSQQVIAQPDLVLDLNQAAPLALAEPGWLARHGWQARSRDDAVPNLVQLRQRNPCAV